MPKKTTKPAETNNLHEILAGLRKDLNDARRSLSANELPNPGVIRTTRREIARTLTAINADRKKEATHA